MPAAPLRRKIPIDTRPLHLRVEEAMETVLQDYAPGERLPSEAELARLLGVSRATIREVLRALEERGRINRRHGVGTFMATGQPVVESGLELLESLDVTASRMGLVCEVHNLSISQQEADATLADKLKLPVGSLLTVVSRTRTIQGNVIAYLYDVIPASIVTPEDLQQGEFSGSMLDYFIKTGDPNPAYAVTTLLSIQASQDLAMQLQVLPGTALLLLEETLYSSDNRLINYSHNYYNTAHFHYHIVRRSAV
jgi:GntR family transcriptional regulator